ncbi:MAG TPA: glutamine synthetase family protein, partial [Thermomicrobiales bacterium]|nr:glutamine synthetase family protein [Thermomicrobiales bacterium]
MSTPHQDDGSGALLERLARDEIDHLWVVYTDYNGRSQGKSVPRSRFAATAQRGITFARANLGHNLTDHAPDDTMFGADSGDFFAVPDPNAYAPYPPMPATARAMCWMRQEGGAPWDGCPRTALQRQIDAYAARGLRLQAAFEPEGYLFQLAPDGGPVPAVPPGMFSVAALETQAELLHRISDTLEEMGIEVEQIAPEWGPGQFEVNLRHAAPLRAADNLVALKDVVRALARREGLIASFMPKPRDTLGGCGLHVHLSLWDERGESVTEGADHPSGLSETAAACVAGLLAHARALVGVGAPTVNSYKRLLPGSWAPAHAAYAVGNRSALVRIPGGARRRIEFRAGDNLSNPYLFLAALLAAGLDGIDRSLESGE